jgi:hypothetical protein
VTLCQGKQPATSPTGSLHVEIWNDASGAPATNGQVGGDSDSTDISSLADLAPTTGAPCGTASHGQEVSYTWSSNLPTPSSDFWIVIVADSGFGATGVRSGATATTVNNLYPQGCTTDCTDYDLFSSNTDVNEDAYFKVSTQ